MASILFWIIVILVSALLGVVIGFICHVIYSLITNWKIKRNIPTSLEPENPEGTNNSLAYAGKDEINEKEVNESYVRPRDKIREFERIRKLATGKPEIETIKSAIIKQGSHENGGNVPSGTDTFYSESSLPTPERTGQEQSRQDSTGSQYHKRLPV